MKERRRIRGRKKGKAEKRKKVQIWLSAKAFLLMVV
jgi:hypothetical protein